MAKVLTREELKGKASHCSVEIYESHEILRAQLEEALKVVNNYCNYGDGRAKESKKKILELEK